MEVQGGKKEKKKRKANPFRQHESMNSPCQVREGEFFTEKKEEEEVVTILKKEGEWWKSNYAER
jgi:hypothetical protein